jgi:hypothetical protein
MIVFGYYGTPTSVHCIVDEFLDNLTDKISFSDGIFILVSHTTHIIPIPATRSTIVAA